MFHGLGHPLNEKIEKEGTLLGAVRGRHTNCVSGYVIISV